MKNRKLSTGFASLFLAFFLLAGVGWADRWDRSRERDCDRKEYRHHHKWKKDGWKSHHKDHRRYDRDCHDCRPNRHRPVKIHREEHIHIHTSPYYQSPVPVAVPVPVPSHVPVPIPVPGHAPFPFGKPFSETEVHFGISVRATN